MQSTDTVLMIEPVAFEFNEQTAVNNYFQTEKGKDLQKSALEEFGAFTKKLKKQGIGVITVKDTEVPHTPDSIFPNNWVSFHQDGVVCLYPMFAENRRLERRSDVLELLKKRGFKIAEIKDYSTFEKKGKYLEGTGSMVLDRKNKIAYGAISPRLDKTLFKKWCLDFGYQAVAFRAFQSVEGKRLPIYHTNVMMSLGSDFAIVCLDSVDKPSEQSMLMESIYETKREIIEISEEQVGKFLGNVLELRNSKGKKFLVMSSRAYGSLSPCQINRIEHYAEIIHTDLYHIENNGGGSVRCMMAEIFCPK